MSNLKSVRQSLVLAVTACHLAMPSVFAAQESPASYLTWDKDSMPIVYYVNADDAAAWPEGVGAIIRSFMSWGRIPGAYVALQYAGTTDKKGAYDDGQNIVTWVTKGWPYGSDTVAFAVLWVSPNDQSIVGTDILINGQDFVWATDGDPRAVDVQDAITHEVGHALGLPHSVSSPDVTMFPVILPGETKKRSIGEDERSIVRLIYPCGITSAITYAFSADNGALLAEKALADYPPASESGTIFLLTRVDEDGDGLDEIGIIQENDGQSGFYLFPAVTSDFPPSEPLAYDAWSIPAEGNMDLTALDMDGDGREEIGALRAESDGSYALYIYNTPIPSDFTRDDAPWLVLRQALLTTGGDNLIAAVGLDYDGDGIDEVGALRLTPRGQYFFDAYYIGATDKEPRDPFISIPLGRNLGLIDLDASDIDGDEHPELITLWKDSRGSYVSAFQLPDRSAPPEKQRLTFLATVPVALPDGDAPMRISALRIAGPDTLPRPAICILVGE